MKIVKEKKPMTVSEKKLRSIFHFYRNHAKTIVFRNSTDFNRFEVRFFSFRTMKFFFLFRPAAEESEKQRRDQIDQKQVLRGTSTAPSEINWTPATMISNKKQLSSALGIVRSVDKTASATSPETINNKKSLVSYDDEDSS